MMRIPDISAQRIRTDARRRPRGRSSSVLAREHGGSECHQRLAEDHDRDDRRVDEGDRRRGGRGGVAR